MAVVGWAGALLVLLAYGDVARNGPSGRYHGLNLAGAGLLTITAFDAGVVADGAEGRLVRDRDGGAAPDAHRSRTPA